MAQDQIILAENYQPTQDKEYMGPLMLEYFRKKLEKYKEDINNKSSETLAHLKEENMHEPDLNDRASIETSLARELHDRSRHRKLLDKIDDALKRIKNKQYGYCEYCDVPNEQIGVKRLEARPFTTLCIQAQEAHEDYERVYRDD